MSSPDRFRDLGLLLLRVGIGGMFMVHGWPKLAGGAASWAKLGKAMAHVGIEFAPTFFGLMASLSEFFGGLLLALGLLFRPAAGLMLATMAVATTMHLQQGDGIGGASHAIEAAIVFASLLLIGPGKHSLAGKLGGGS
jgi:putative oxidoreductase